MTGLNWYHIEKGQKKKKKSHSSYTKIIIIKVANQAGLPKVFLFSPRTEKKVTVVLGLRGGRGLLDSQWHLAV